MKPAFKQIPTQIAWTKRRQMSVRFTVQEIAQPLRPVTGRRNTRVVFQCFKKVFKENVATRSGNIYRQGKLKTSFRSCKFRRKAGFIHINLPGQSAWPLTSAWLQLWFWWLMETSAFLTTLL